MLQNGYLMKSRLYAAIDKSTLSFVYAIKGLITF